MSKENKHQMVSTAEQTLEFRTSIHNRFDIEVRDATTGELKQRARAYNLICEALWDRLLAHGSNNAWWPQGYFNFICFGSGSGTPSASDTTLFTQLGSRELSNYTLYDEIDQIAAGVVYAQASIRLNAEEYVGSMLTEVGIAYDATHIVTHAMLQDMNGNPISIEKTATDVIDIYATVYVHFPAGGWYNGSITVAPPYRGHPYRFFTIFTGKPTTSSGVMYCNGADIRTGIIKGTSYAGMNPIVNRVNKTITMASRISAGDFNLPIRAILIASQHSNSGLYAGPASAFWLTMGGWFTAPVISGEAVGTGDGTTTGFATAFPVKTVGTVYVDGVVASGVMMRPGPANVEDLGTWIDVCYKTVANTAAFDNSGYFDTSYNCIRIELNANAKSKILESPFPALGIAKLNANTNGAMKVLVSDDLVTWTEAGTFQSTGGSWADLAIPSALRSKRYFQIENTAGSWQRYLLKFVGNAADLEHNIVFSTPPAAGAVITADYTPDCIAKDANHVFDLNMVMTLGECS